MFDLVFNNVQDKSFQQDFFINIFEKALKILNIDSQDIELSLNLVGEEKIQELNKKYRQKNKVTDVISFPMLEDGIEKLKTEKLIPSFSRDWELGTVVDLGDIFICLPFAKKQAKLENVNIEQKLSQLTVHGFLHLLGYDHERSEKDAKGMFNLEKIILEKCSK